MFEVQTPQLIATNFLLIVIIYYSLQPAYYYLEETPRQRFCIGVGCIFLFCMFSFWGSDWFSYQHEYLLVKESEWYRTKTSLESFYIWLILISPHYFFFRFVVWGSALFFVLLTMKRLKVDYDLAWFFFGVLYLPHFSYGRVSLAMAVMLYGAVLISHPLEKKKRLSLVLGGIFVVGSVFFHKSAALGILVICFSLFCRTTNKNSWFYIAVAFIGVVLVMRYIVGHFMGSTFEAEEGMAGKSLRAGQNYMNHENSTRGIGGIISSLLERIPYYMVASLSYLIQSFYKVPKGIGNLLKIELYLVIFASVFIIDLGANTSTIYGRLLRFTIIPSSMILAYAYQYDLFPKFTRIIFFIGLSGTFYRLTYLCYDRIVNS